MDRGGNSAEVPDGAVDPLFVGPYERPIRVFRGAAYNVGFFNCGDGGLEYAWKHSQTSGFRVVLGKILDPGETEDPETLEGARRLEQLPYDKQGFRKIPLNKEWWPWLYCKAIEEGIWVRPFRQRCGIGPRYFFDASQKTEISMRCQLGWLETRTDLDLADFIFSLESYEDPDLAHVTITTGPARDYVAAVKPGSWFRIHLLIDPTNSEKENIVVTVFGDNGAGGEKILQSCQFPVTEMTKTCLKHVKFQINSTNDPNTTFTCTEVLFRQNIPSKAAFFF